MEPCSLIVLRVPLLIDTDNLCILEVMTTPDPMQKMIVALLRKKQAVEQVHLWEYG